MLSAVEPKLVVPDPVVLGSGEKLVMATFNARFLASNTPERYVSTLLDFSELMLIIGRTGFDQVNVDVERWSGGCSTANR